MMNPFIPINPSLLGGNYAFNPSSLVEGLCKTSPILIGMMHGMGHSLGNSELELIAAAGIPQLAAIKEDISIKKMKTTEFNETFNDHGKPAQLSFDLKNGCFIIPEKQKDLTRKNIYASNHILTGIMSGALYGIGYSIGHFLK